MKIVLPLIATVIALSACGGGGDSSSNASTSAASDTALLAYLDTTNVASAGFPWGGQFPGVVKRWELPVPVKTNGEARAAVAMDAIESKLGYKVFDRTSIENTPNDTITRGVVFSQGTSFLPSGGNPQSFCANVASGPNAGGYPPQFVKAPGTISTKLFVNLDNPQCVASPDIVIHELGHALGLGSHFEGFGDSSGAISGNFWNLLATLYNNAAGTAKANIVVKRAG